jgi:hypothetical protein
MMYAKQFTDAKILSKMGKEPMTPAAIAEKVGCSVITIIRALPRLEEDMSVERVVIKNAGGKTVSGYFTDYNERKKGRRGFI